MISGWRAVFHDLFNTSTALTDVRPLVWLCLLCSQVTFTAISRTLGNIETCHMRADKAYRRVLERYSSSAKILRMYASFLEEVKGDPWTAAQYYAEAEKLEEGQTDNMM